MGLVILGAVPPWPHPSLLRPHPRAAHSCPFVPGAYLNLFETSRILSFCRLFSAHWLPFLQKVRVFTAAQGCEDQLLRGEHLVHTLTLPGGFMCSLLVSTQPQPLLLKRRPWPQRTATISLVISDFCFCCISLKAVGCRYSRPEEPLIPWSGDNDGSQNDREKSLGLVNFRRHG